MTLIIGKFKITGKVILKFILIAVVSFFAFEALEHLLLDYFELTVDDFGIIGWLGVVIYYGFTSHILCCLLPLIWAGYKCQHKECDHDHCNFEDK